MATKRKSFFYFLVFIFNFFSSTIFLKKKGLNDKYKKIVILQKKGLIIFVQSQSIKPFFGRDARVSCNFVKMILKKTTLI